MSAREFARWRVFYSRFPFDDESVHVLQVAALEARLANLFRTDGSAIRPITEFMKALCYRETLDPNKKQEANEAEETDTWGAKLARALDAYAAHNAPSE